jgi:hypothetical protein
VATLSPPLLVRLRPLTSVRLADRFQAKCQNTLIKLGLVLM